MTFPKLLLVSDPGKSREHYLAELAKYDVEVDAVSSGHDLYTHCGDKDYSALLIDLRTIINTGAKNKMLIEEISLKIPTIRLHVNPSNGVISGLMYDRKVPERDALKIFVEQTKEFKPTKIRLARRVNTVLNAFITKTPELDEEASIKANIINISRNGCFITTQHFFDKEEFIYIHVLEFEIKMPIKCEIRWIQPWGAKNKLPGIGVKLHTVTDDQISEIDKYIRAGVTYKLTV